MGALIATLLFIGVATAATADESPTGLPAPACVETACVNDFVEAAERLVEIEIDSIHRCLEHHAQHLEAASTGFRRSRIAEFLKGAQEALSVCVNLSLRDFPHSVSMISANVRKICGASPTSCCSISGPSLPPLGPNEHL